MAQRQLPKVYLRVDPNIDAHPDPGTMLLMMIWANRQPHRGRFRSLDTLRRVVGAKKLQAAIQRADLRPDPEGGYYLVGWDEWQEGDQTVGERVAKVRQRRANERKDASPNTRADLRASSRYPTVTEPLLNRYPPSEALGVRRSSPVATLPENRPAGRPPFVAELPVPPGPSPLPSADPPVAGESVANLCAECEALLERGAAAAAGLGAAWDPGTELERSSRTARDGFTLALQDLAQRRKSASWWQATRDRLRDRVTALEAGAAVGRPDEPDDGSPVAIDRAATALWDRVRERMRADVPPHSWRLWLAPTLGAALSDRLAVAVPRADWGDWCRAYEPAAIAAAAAEGCPVVGVDWVSARQALEATTDEAALWVRSRWPALRVAIEGWLRDHRAPDEPLVSALWRWADEPSDGPPPPPGVPRTLAARLDADAGRGVA